MFRLKLYELNKKLLIPENRKIINKYMNEENKKIANQVYKPLQREHPSLEEFTKRLLIGYDHISYLDKIKNNMLINYFSIKDRDILLDLFKSTLHKEPEYEIIIKETKLKKTEQKKIINTYEKFFSKRNTFYTDLINATNKVDKNQYGINKIMHWEQYSDAVLKKIFPLKEQQLRYWIEDLKLERKILEYTRKKIDSIKELGFDLEELKEFKEQDKMIPSIKAIEEIQPGLFEYRMQTIDRIYGDRKFGRK
jgi:hypothetical protein